MCMCTIEEYKVHSYSFVWSNLNSWGAIVDLYSRRARFWKLFVYKRERREQVALVVRYDLYYSQGPLF